jgi:hypothetical protein
MHYQSKSSDFEPHSNLGKRMKRLGKHGLTLILAIAITLSSSCASNKHKPHKKLKPGKPIPCPMKDC